MLWRPGRSFLKTETPCVDDLVQCSEGDRRVGQNLNCFQFSPAEGKPYHLDMSIGCLLGSAWKPDF
eukprot:1137446-Pelagomonas_calceolata.AAC.14